MPPESYCNELLARVPGLLRGKRRLQVFAGPIRLGRVAVLAEHHLVLSPRHISLIQKIIHLPRVEITAALEIFADGRLRGGFIVGCGGFGIISLSLERVGETEP